MVNFLVNMLCIINDLVAGIFYISMLSVLVKLKSIIAKGINRLNV